MVGESAVLTRLAAFAAHANDARRSHASCRHHGVDSAVDVARPCASGRIRRGLPVSEDGRPNDWSGVAARSAVPRSELRRGNESLQPTRVTCDPSMRRGRSTSREDRRLRLSLHPRDIACSESARACLLRQTCSLQLLHWLLERRSSGAHGGTAFPGRLGRHSRRCACACLDAAARDVRVDAARISHHAT